MRVWEDREHCWAQLWDCKQYHGNCNGPQRDCPLDGLQVLVGYRSEPGSEVHTWRPEDYVIWLEADLLTIPRLRLPCTHVGLESCLWRLLLLSQAAELVVDEILESCDFLRDHCWHVQLLDSLRRLYTRIRWSLHEERGIDHGHQLDDLDHRYGLLVQREPRHGSKLLQGWYGDGWLTFLFLSD